jgi:hypothetical protein
MKTGDGPSDRPAASAWPSRESFSWGSVGSSEPIGSGGNTSADEGTSQAANLEPPHLDTDWGARRIDYSPQRPAMPSVLFKLSTGDWYSREVESEDAAVKQVKSFFDRHDEYLRDWIRVDGNAWIARSAVVAVEVREGPAPEAAIR